MGSTCVRKRDVGVPHAILLACWIARGGPKATSVLPLNSMEWISRTSGLLCRRSWDNRTVVHSSWPFWMLCELLFTLDSSSKDRECVRSSSSLSHVDSRNSGALSSTHTFSCSLSSSARRGRYRHGCSLPPLMLLAPAANLRLSRTARNSAIRFACISVPRTIRCGHWLLSSPRRAISGVARYQSKSNTTKTPATNRREQ